MAEYEGKADSEICASCRFFVPTVGMRGLCNKHPRIAQKEDDRTHATNWCQFYEANVDKKKLLEDAVQMLTPDPNSPITLTSEERERMNAMQGEDDEEVASTASPHDWINDPLVAAAVVNENIRNELAGMLRELIAFRINAERQLITATLADDNFSMMEMKGVLRVSTMFQTQIENRIGELSNEAERYADPHDRDVH